MQLQELVEKWHSNMPSKSNIPNKMTTNYWPWVSKFALVFLIELALSIDAVMRAINFHQYGPCLILDAMQVVGSLLYPKSFFFADSSNFHL